MKIKDIQKAVTVGYNSPFNLKANYCVVSNVSWGLFTWGEADLIALRKSGYLIEGEIKISKQDFLKDKDKKKFNNCLVRWEKDIKEFYYIVPEELSDFAMANTSYGVIATSITNYGYSVKVLRGAIVSKNAVKLPEKQQVNLLRLGCFRFWKELFRND